MGSGLALRAYGATFLGVLGHGSSEFFAVLSGVGGVEVSVWRFLVGGTCLLIVALAMKSSRDLLRPVREQPVRVIGLSVLGMALGQLLFHWSLDFASVVQVATVVTTMPIVTVLAHSLIHRTAIPVPKIVSGLGALCGVTLLLTDGYLSQLEFGGEALTGIIMAVGCATIGGFYLVLVKPLVVAYGAIRMTALTFIFGAAALWITAGLFWNIWVDPSSLFDRPPRAYLSILTLGIWNTCLGFILWLWGLSAVPDMGRINYLFFLKPVVATILSYLFLTAVISPIQLAAIATVCGFVLIEIFYDRIKSILLGLKAV